VSKDIPKKKAAKPVAIVDTVATDDETTLEAELKALEEIVIEQLKELVAIYEIKSLDPAWYSFEPSGALRADIAETIGIFKKRPREASPEALEWLKNINRQIVKANESRERYTRLKRARTIVTACETGSGEFRKIVDATPIDSENIRDIIWFAQTTTLEREQAILEARVHLENSFEQLQARAGKAGSKSNKRFALAYEEIERYYLEKRDKNSKPSIQTMAKNLKENHLVKWAEKYAEQNNCDKPRIPSGRAIQDHLYQLKKNSLRPS
jgi:hypothetical protein